MMKLMASSQINGTKFPLLVRAVRQNFSYSTWFDVRIRPFCLRGRIPLAHVTYTSHEICFLREQILSVIDPDSCNATTPSVLHIFYDSEKDAITL